MPKKSSELAVGLTVLAALALAAWVVIALADWKSLFRSEQRLTVKLPYQTGLKGLAPGSPITLGGAKIGSITQTGLLPSDPAVPGVFVFFTMVLPRDYQLRSDALLAPESNVLGGQAILAIRDLGATGELLADGSTTALRLEGSIAEALDVVRRELDTDLPDSLLGRLKRELDRGRPDSLLTELVTTAANLRAITAKIDRQVTLDPNQQSLLAKLNSSLDKLDASLGEVQTLVAAGRPDITAILASLRTTAAAVEKDAPDILTNLKTGLARANSALDAARPVIADLKSITGTTKDLLLVSRPQLEKLIANLSETSSNLKLTSRDVRRAPWKLLYTPKKDEVQIQGLIDSAGDFAAGAERLDSAAQTLSTLLARPGAELPIDRQRLESLLAELETTFAQFHSAESKFWSELK